MRLSYLVKIQPVRLLKIQPAPTRLRAALALQFPNQNFLRVNYVEQAPAVEKAE